ncbi:MAG TPA: ORF6N domain-containing protein [Candidatus Caccenecus avistercoris]|nr:ORF6N domain-containing protein [Candidatus Caccenecus avistercoris]
MNNIVVKKEEKLTNLIYEIRGKQVMLDRDLAKLYKTETRVLIQKLKRNIERFPEEFCFQLNQKEFLNWRSQNVMSNNDKIGLRRPPYVFTEQGVAMLSAILNSEVAIEVSIAIMNAFVAMRKYIGVNLIEQKYINNLVLEDHNKIQVLEESFQKLEEKRKDSEIYFNGQIYDAYSKILDIFKSAKKELIIIDAYADKTLLDIIKEVPNINVTIITKTPSLLSKTTIEKYNKEYHNLVIKYDNTFHDRYFILDNSIVYHCGASINRIGYKTFSITKIGDKKVIAALITQINKII